MKQRLALVVTVLLLGSMALPRGPAGEAGALDDSGIDWWVLSGAGATATGSAVMVNDTVGQAVVGGSAYEAVTLSAGFWYRGLGPTSVHLLSFEAVPLRAVILVSWETIHEIDNLGFNLYRANSEAGPMARLNDTLIPTQVPPGSPFGAVYQWLDGEGLTPGQIYYYWLEAVDLHGHTALHGPVYATASGEEAVFLPFVMR